MIIVFTGHRDCLANESDLDSLYDEFSMDDIPILWVYGGAKTGFDNQIQLYIEKRIIPFEVYLPQYDKYSPKFAPIARNHQMIDLKPDLLVALWDGRKFGGTNDTIEYAKSKGVPIKYLEVAKHIKLPAGRTKVY